MLFQGDLVLALTSHSEFSDEFILVHIRAVQRESQTRRFRYTPKWLTVQTFAHLGQKQLFQTFIVVLNIYRNTAK